MVSGMSPSVTGADAHGLRRLPGTAGVFAHRCVDGAMLSNFCHANTAAAASAATIAILQQEAPPARRRRFDGRGDRALRDVVRLKGLVHR